MNEKEKMISGLEYYPDKDETLVNDRKNAKRLCFEYNNSFEKHKEIYKKLFSKVGENTHIEPYFFCDYGYNIEIGNNFYSNHNLVILDCAKVKFGDNVFIGPNCGFYTAEHPTNTEKRLAGIETAKPITIGNNVWLGGNVTVLSGVTIGDNSVIGAGSIVTKDIPSNSIAVGNHCKVIKPVS